jgi:hypothetical protein
MDFAGVLFGEVSPAADFWAPNVGEPEAKVLAVRSPSKITCLSRGREGFHAFDKVTNGNSPWVAPIGKIVVMEETHFTTHGERDIDGLSRVPQDCRKFTLDERL